MSEGISLFSGYNQKENRHTNYCLLMLKLLYEEIPKYPFSSEAINVSHRSIQTSNFHEPAATTPLRFSPVLLTRVCKI